MLLVGTCGIQYEADIRGQIKISRAAKVGILNF